MDLIQKTADFQRFPIGSCRWSPASGWWSATLAPIPLWRKRRFFSSIRAVFFCSQSNNKPATFWCFVQPIHFAIFGRIIGELWEAWGWFMILWLLTSNTNDVFKPTFSSADSPPSALRCNAATLCKASLSRVSRDLKQCTPERCATATTGTVGL